MSSTCHAILMVMIVLLWSSSCIGSSPQEEGEGTESSPQGDGKGQGRSFGDAMMSIGGVLGQVTGGLGYVINAIAGKNEDEKQVSQFKLPNGEVYHDAVIGDPQGFPSYVPKPNMYYGRRRR